MEQAMSGTVAAGEAAPRAEHPPRSEVAARPRSGSAGAFLLAAGTLWQREMVRFLRQRNRVIGAVVTPIVFWLLLGSGLDRVFQVDPAAPQAADGAGYLAYFFPGTITMILLFTAIFSTISVIEDRREGFLQSVLVAPVSRLAIVLGKVLGGATIATGGAAVFLLLWPVVAPLPDLATLVTALLAMFVLAMGLTGLGLCVAWPMDSTAGFHAIMNLVLMPMWFLCGAVFPVATAPLWMKLVMYANPLTYGQAVVSGLLVGGDPTGLGLPLPIAAAVMLLFTAATITLAARIARRPEK